MYRMSLNLSTYYISWLILWLWLRACSCEIQHCKSRSDNNLPFRIFMTYACNVYFVILTCQIKSWFRQNVLCEPQNTILILCHIFITCLCSYSHVDTLVYLCPRSHWTVTLVTYITIRLTKLWILHGIHLKCLAAPEWIGVQWWNLRQVHVAG